MKLYFPAYMDKAADGSYGAIFPDVPGCYANGDTIDLAIEDGSKALAQHLEALRDMGQPIPVPSPMEKIIANQPRKTIIAMVPGRLPAKPVRVNITIDKDLLEEMDEIASNRSRFISEAVADKLRARERRRSSKNL